MRLLYICGTYAPGARSGSELSAHTLLRQLVLRHGVEVLVGTDARYTGGVSREGEYQGIRLKGIGFEDRQAGIKEAVAIFQPQILFTQLNWADEALRIGKECGIATILRVASSPIRLDLRTPAATAPISIVVGSRFMADHVWSASGRGAHVIPPCVDLEQVRSTGTADRRFITMFNPIEAKGGALFRDLAAALPDRDFAIVPGWSVLRDPDGRWNERLWRQSLESQGLDWYPMPREVDFGGLPNVTVLPPTDEVAELYRFTRLLCVPSRWNEPFGRVAIEGFANGIPVIASADGGLQNLTGIAGVILPREAGVSTWIDAVERLDDQDEYRREVDRGRRAAEERFGFSATVDPFFVLLRELVPEQIPLGQPEPRVLILVLWFGPWPEWMEILLETCRWNPTIDWLILSDNPPLGSVSSNVRFAPITLREVEDRAERELGYRIPIGRPYKLCDLRLGFPALFAEFAQGYDYVGWSDLDVVYGDLREYLRPSLSRYDVISFNALHLSGHLTVVRNTPETRQMVHRMGAWAREVIAPEYRHLDEVEPDCLPIQYTVLARESFNTPLSPRIPWRDGRFVFPSEWYWRSGKLTTDLDQGVEFPYLHFMHWKGGEWARQCGNAQWERLERVVHLDRTRIAEGFRVNERGFFPLEAGPGSPG